MGKKTKTDANGKTETTTLLQRVGSRFQGVPLPFTKTIGSAIAKRGSQEVFHEERAEDIKKYGTANIKALDNQGLINRANSATAFVNPTEAAAIAQELAKRDLMTSTNPKTGKLNIDPTRIQKFIDNSERMGNVQSILNNRPELAAKTSAGKQRQKMDPSTGRPMVDPVTGLPVLENAIEAAARAIGDATKKIKVADVLDVNEKSMGNAADPTALPTADQYSVVINMSTQQLRKLGTEGTDNQARAFKNSIEKLWASSQIPGAAPLSAPQMAKLTKLHEYVIDNPEWKVI